MLPQISPSTRALTIPICQAAADSQHAHKHESDWYVVKSLALPTLAGLCVWTIGRYISAAPEVVDDNAFTETSYGGSMLKLAALIAGMALFIRPAAKMEKAVSIYVPVRAPASESPLHPSQQHGSALENAEQKGGSPDSNAREARVNNVSTPAVHAGVAESIDQMLKKAIAALIRLDGQPEAMSYAGDGPEGYEEGGDGPEGSVGKGWVVVAEEKSATLGTAELAPEGHHVWLSQYAKEIDEITSLTSSANTSINPSAAKKAISRQIANILDLGSPDDLKVKTANGQLSPKQQALLGDQDILLLLSLASHEYLALAPIDLKDDYNFMLAAVQHNGLALDFASASLQKNETIVAAANKQNRRASEYVMRMRDLRV